MTTISSSNAPEASTTSASSSAAPVPNPKYDYIMAMRKEFCLPAMLNPDHTLNEEYFRAPKQTWWTREEEDKLFEAIETVGVGAWGKIREQYFPARHENEIRIKTMTLLGKQDLSGYDNWRGNREAIEAERKKNVKEGEAKGLLVSGVFVDERFGVL